MGPDRIQRPPRAPAGLGSLRAAPIGGAGKPDGCRHHYHPGVSDQPPAPGARNPDQLRARRRRGARARRPRRVAGRLREGDGRLWGPAGSPEIANRLGWLTIVERMLAELEEIEEFAAEVRAGGHHRRGPARHGRLFARPRRCCARVRRAAGAPGLQVLDSTDARQDPGLSGRGRTAQDAVHGLLQVRDGTIEPLSLFAHFWSLERRAAALRGRSPIPVRGWPAGRGTLFQAHVRRRPRHRRALQRPVRNSGSCPPRSWASTCAPCSGAAIGVGDRDPGRTTPPARAGAARWPPIVARGGLSALAHTGRDKLTFLISASLPGLGLWLEQLVAESTGKHGDRDPAGRRGAAGRPGGLRRGTRLRLPAGLRPVRRTLRWTRAWRALADAGHPVITSPDARAAVTSAGCSCLRARGRRRGLGPSDQPLRPAQRAAGEGRHRRRVLADYESAGSSPPGERDGGGEAARAAARRASPPDYVAIMAYLEPDRRLR